MATPRRTDSDFSRARKAVLGALNRTGTVNVSKIANRYNVSPQAVGGIISHWNMGHYTN